MATKPATRTFTVQLNLQQYQILEDVRKQGALGREDSEVLRRVFLTWYRKKQGRSPGRISPRKK